MATLWGKKKGMQLNTKSPKSKMKDVFFNTLGLFLIFKFESQ